MRRYPQAYYGYAAAPVYNPQPAGYNPVAGTGSAGPQHQQPRSWKDVVNKTASGAAALPPPPSCEPPRDPRLARSKPPPPPTPPPPKQPQHLPVLNPAPAPGLSEEERAGKIPQAVTDYVFRAYATCKTGGEQDAMERALKMVINSAKQTGVLYTRNWAKFPAPIVSDQPHSKLQESEFRPAPPASPAFGAGGAQATKLSKKQEKKEKKKVEMAKRSSLLDEALLSQSQVKKQKHKQDTDSDIASLRNNAMNEKRAQRFGDEKPTRAASTHNKFYQPTNELSVNDDGTIDLDSLRVIGTCEVLEKHYLRLTSAPDPSTVRPVRVLTRTLEMLLQKWEARTPATSEAVYLYLSDQFRSMRQDLTVQNVKTDFAVTVYERNARIALEMADLHEFNACQTQLWSLFQVVPNCSSVVEFTSYRILYFVLTQNNAELSAMLKSASFIGFGDPVVWHAEATRRAVEDVNWVAFARLVAAAPNMNGHLMKMIARVR